jgi:hypothetical protein
VGPAPPRGASAASGSASTHLGVVIIISYLASLILAFILSRPLPMQNKSKLSRIDSAFAASAGMLGLAAAFS